MAGLIGGLAGQLGPIAKLIGLDKIAGKLTRDFVGKRMNAAIPKVVKRLTEDHLTPAEKALSPEGERLFIRAAMYLLAKEVFAGVLPKGANLAADFLRDQHDDKVVALVSPQIDAASSTDAAVRVVAKEFLNRVF